MPISVALETTSVEMWNHLQSLQIEGVHVGRVIRLAEESKLKLIVVFASGVAVNLFSSALYDALKQFQPHETTIDSKQVPTNQVQIGVLINSQVQIQQSGTKAECEKNQSNDSHNAPP